MRRALKILGIAVLSLVGLLVLAVGGVYAWTGKQMAARVPVPAHGFTAPRDSASVARGQHVAQALAKCVDCHGTNMAGNATIDDPAIGHAWASNLTTGQGGVLGQYSDAELEAAIRHGIGRDGRRLMIMPSDEYQVLSDDDLGALIAYMRSVPPVDHVAPKPTTLGPVGRGLYAAGILPLYPADRVTHRDEVVTAPPKDSTVAYGQYLINGGCVGCHGPNLSGGPMPGTPPDWPTPANITPTGIGTWTQADFTRALREGVRPDGSAINPFMPIAATKLMTDVEIVALYKYLQTVPAKASGGR